MPVPVSSQLEPLPGYKLIDRLGRGGFGEVWRVEAPGGLQKAMKFVFGDLNNLDDDNIRAAEQELKALDRVKNIRHPFILSLEQWKIINGQLIIVMELAERNLWDRFKECRGLGMPGIPREELMGYMNEAAEALDLMNTKYHIQHLDVKPQNLFLMYNHVKVADFGLAKTFEGGRGTVTGGVTPVYAGPETFEGYVSRFTDQYSLAIVFQELLTGTRPFNGSNTEQLVMQHLNGTPDLEHVPATDRSILARALSKKPEDRWPSCTDMVRALRSSGSPAAGSGSVGKEEATANRTPPRGLSAATQQLVGGDLTPVGPTVAPTGVSKPELNARDSLRPKPSNAETPSATNSVRMRSLHPGTSATGTTPFPLQTPKLVTPQGAASLVLGDPSSPAGKSLRPLAVPTAKMGELGFVGPARTGDGILMPALIVGAGASGLLAIRAMKRILRERFGPEPLPHIRFLLVDTDPDTVAAATDANVSDALSPQEVVVARLNRAAHYLQRDGMPSVESWMPKGVLYKLPRNPGAAAGVRAYGRLALADNYKAVVGRVRQDIEAFVSDGAIDAAVARTGLGLRSNRTRIYVIANTCGGTGSGMFLDLAFILKNELRQIGHIKPEAVGTLFVPAADKTAAKGLPLANAFAALQELQYFHGGRNKYQARFLNNEPIADSDGPFARCNLVQLDKRVGAPELSYAAGLVARTIFLELFSPAGRVMDSVRGEAFGLNRTGEPVVQATGLYRLSWPRHELLEVATRRFGQRLLQRWTAKEAGHLREPVQQWLDEQWRLRNLDLEVVVDEFNQAVKDSLREEPERVFAAFVSPLRQRAGGTGGRLDVEAAYDILEQLVKVVGTPEVDAEKSPSLQDVLAERHRRLAQDVEGHLSAMAVAFIEQPQYRLGGAEEVLAQMIARLKRTVGGLESVRSGILDEVHDAYSQLAQVLTGAGPSLALSMIGTRKSVATGEFLNALEEYPNKRLRLHVLDSTLSIYRRLLASAPEFVREIGFCRGRLQEMAESIQTKGTGDRYLTGPGRMILPHGVEGIDGAADHFLGSLAHQDILDFDAKLQEEIAKKYRSLVNVCVHPQNAAGFLQLLAAQSRQFLESRIGRSNAASVFFRHRNESAPNTPKMLMNSFEEAAPDLTSVSGKPQMEATILAVPDGPDGDRFRQTVDALLPGIGFIPATLDDDIVFVREYPLLPLAELPQLAAHAREAYRQQLAAENNPHTRSDLPWVPADAVPAIGRDERI